MATTTATKRRRPLAEFPMVVLPASRVLTLESLPKHEEIKSELIEVVDGMTVLFVSQTWLTYGHPDNALGVKLRLLQHFLRRAARGVAIEADTVAGMAFGGAFGNAFRIPGKEVRKIEFVWFDIFSIPQTDSELQGRAIASIPAYVASSAFFACIAGSWKHENGNSRDLRAWLDRGWCRVEMLCNVLAPQARPLIVVQSRDDCCTHAPMGILNRGWFSSSFGLGAFTVDADRVALGPVVERLIDARMAAKLADGTAHGLRWHRFLHAVKASLLLGTGLVVEPILTLSSWMAQLQFRSATGADAHGWGPISYALYEGRIDLVEQLLDAGASVDGVLRQGSAEFGTTKGMGNLNIATQISQDNAAMIKLLVSRGANPSLSASNGLTPFASMCALGHVADIRAMLEVAPQVLLGRNRMIGMLDMLNAAFACQKEALKWLIDNKPECVADATTGFPRGWLSAACEYLGDPEVLSLLVDHGCDPNYHGTIRTSKWTLNALLSVSARAVRTMRRPPKIIEYLAIRGGSAALHVAAHQGNLGAVELLLQRRADIASTQTVLRMTPLHCAAIGGHAEMCAALLQAGAPTSVRDSTGRTPAAWAKRRGNVEIARLLVTGAPARGASYPVGVVVVDAPGVTPTQI